MATGMEALLVAAQRVESHPRRRDRETLERDEELRHGRTRTRSEWAKRRKLNLPEPHQRPQEHERERTPQPQGPRFPLPQQRPMAPAEIEREGQQLRGQLQPFQRVRSSDPSLPLPERRRRVATLAHIGLQLDELAYRAHERPDMSAAARATTVRDARAARVLLHFENGAYARAWQRNEQRYHAFMEAWPQKEANHEWWLQHWQHEEARHQDAMARPMSPRHREDNIAFRNSERQNSVKHLREWDRLLGERRELIATWRRAQRDEGTLRRQMLEMHTQTPTHAQSSMPQEPGREMHGPAPRSPHTKRSM